MIKEIHFKDHKGLDKKEMILNLSKEKNIIIGPKGGGKSTLFNLLAGIQNGFIAKDVIDTYKEREMEFIKVVFYSGEEQYANNFRKENKKKDVQQIFDDSNNIISQEDGIKKSLHKKSEVEKPKKALALKIATESSEAKKLFDKFKGFANEVRLFTGNNNTNINWSNISKVKSAQFGASAFIKLNYNNHQFVAELNEAITTIKNNNLIIESFINDQKRFIKTINNQELINQDYKNNIEKINEKSNIELVKLLEENNLEITRLKRISKLSKVFANAYKDEVDKIKSKDFAKQGVEVFKVSAIDYFKKAATNLKNISSQFSNIMSSETNLSINEKSDNDILTYAINKDITFDDDKTIKLLGKIMYSSNTTSEFSKWVEQAKKKGFKENPEKQFYNELARIIEEDIEILADGKNYETLSPGQKSIFGIKYKFLHSNKGIMFLDQPEDNLDNHTIATTILNLINNKKEQTFIVTHNANIGILSHPEKAIIADIDNEDFDKKYRTNLIEEIKEDPKAFYLEGGEEYLKERYQTIISKGEK